MQTRHPLTKDISSTEFLEYYYLKEELQAFAKANQLPAGGSKQALTKRIAYFLDTGKVLIEKSTTGRTKKAPIETIEETTIIEDNFVCSQQHRIFFKEKIGKGFHFLVPFQTWLKENAGKTYKDAIAAYYEIVENKKHQPTIIDAQFEYNTYIRAFFEDNKGASLQDAIACWNHKKTQKGKHIYEKEDWLHIKDHKG